MKDFLRARLLPAAMILAAGGAAATSATAATVSGLQAQHRRGQTFITFRELSESGTNYTVYRNRSRITSVTGLSPIATVPHGSGVYLHTGDRFVISDAGTPLEAGTGLLVWTTKESGAYYYAVTNSQDSSITLGVNSLQNPVNETRVAVPGAVLMQPRTATTEGYPLFRYFAWEDYETWNPDHGYYGHRFDVAAERFPLDSSRTYPLNVTIHSAGPTKYREPDTYIGAGAQGVYLFPVDLAFLYEKRDPYTGRERPYSGWFGYTTNGVAYSSTENRVKRYIELISTDPQFRVDTDRVYMSGASMGGGGSMHFAYHFPTLFAGVASSTAWVDPFAWGTGYWQANIGAWTAHVPVNSPTGPNWWNWNDMYWLVGTRPPFLPPVVHTFHKDDDTIDEDNYPRLLQRLEENRFPLIAVWNNGGHQSFWLSGAASHRRFKRNEAYPAIADATSSIAFAQQEGQRNQHIDWSSSLHDLFAGSNNDELVDTPNLFRMTFKATNGADATALVTLRNTQQFHPGPGTSLTWENYNFATSQVVASGSATADAQGLVSINIRVLAQGNTLVVRCASCDTGDDRKQIRRFLLADLSPLVVAQINEEDKCIFARVPANTNLRYVRPTIQFAGASVSPASGDEVDFTGPVAFTVEAEDGSTTTYTVVVTSASGTPDCAAPPPPPVDTVAPAPPTNLRVITR